MDLLSRSGNSSCLPACLLWTWTLTFFLYLRWELQHQLCWLSGIWTQTTHIFSVVLALPLTNWLCRSWGAPVIQFHNKPLHNIHVRLMVPFPWGALTDTSLGQNHPTDILTTVDRRHPVGAKWGESGGDTERMARLPNAMRVDRVDVPAITQLCRTVVLQCTQREFLDLTSAASALHTHVRGVDATTTNEVG